MSKASVTIRYDGPALVSHKMDIADLAPALLGMSDICQLANARFNSNRASVRVLISADQEQQCFQFNLEVVQTLWQHTKDFLDGQDVKTAEEILKWLGLIASPIAGLFGVLKWLKNREVAATKFEVQNGKNVAQISVFGNKNNVLVTYPQTVELLEDRAIVDSVKKFVEPVTKEGYDSLEFESSETEKELISKEDANAIKSYTEPIEEELELEEPQTLIAWVKIYSPVYDTSAQQWQFLYGDAHPYMDISDTNIAAQAIERGGALVDDAYRVLLEIRQIKTKTGQFRFKYKIKEVLEFRPAQPRPIQVSLLPDEKS